MGMFDYLRVKKEIPLPEDLKSLKLNWKNLEFQTKDLDNCLLEYFIDEEGHLFEVDVEREYVPFTEEEKKQNKKSGKWHLWKDVIEKSKTNKKINFHGKIKFYTYETLNENEDFCLDYDAYFVYGKLDKIELVKFEKLESRKKSLEKFFKEIEEKENTFSRRLKKKMRRLGWDFFWKRVAKLMRFFSRKFDSAFYFIHSKLL